MKEPATTKTSANKRSASRKSNPAAGSANGETGDVTLYTQWCNTMKEEIMTAVTKFENSEKTFKK